MLFFVSKLRLLSRTQRVQAHKIEGLWSQKPVMVCFWGPESLDIGYLDLLESCGPMQNLRLVLTGALRAWGAARLQQITFATMPFISILLYSGLLYLGLSSSP